MVYSSNNQSIRSSIVAALKFGVLAAVIQLLFSHGINAQPSSSKDPVDPAEALRENTTGFPQAVTIFPGDPFTKITVGDVVNDGGVSTGCSWADYDNDGDLDLYVSNYGHNNFFYVNNGNGTFTKTTAIHIIHPGNSNAGNWGDYDNDGDLDVIVSNDGLYYDMNSWFQNNGDGSFTQIVLGPMANDGGASQGVCWADYDNDGHLDLFIPNGFLSSQDNFLYRNNGDGTFTRITTGSLVTDGGSSRSAGWADYENDGDADLFVANAAGEDNFFYVNNGDGTFRKDTTSIIANDGGFSVGSSWADYDNDGDLDLFVTNTLGEDNFFYVNNGDGTFRKDTTSIIANDGGFSVGSSWADYDNDGDLDLFVCNTGADNFLYQNNGDGTFTKITNSIVANDGGNSEGCTWADYDNDGDLDLFVSNNGMQNNFLYANNGNGNGWVNITCTGVTSNRSGIGTNIRAKATINGQPIWQQREIEGQTGSRGQNSLNVEFGFGNATIIDTLKITWPSGTVDIFTSVSVNQFITATEGEGISSVGSTGSNVFQDLQLLQNFPNPFNPRTRIQYSIPQPSHVTLKIYTMLGQELATLVDEHQEAGHHQVEFSPLGKSSGAYFYRLTAGSLSNVKKLVLTK
jgi:hypothetical protein